MKISDQGFTERIPSQTSRTSGVNGVAGQGSSSIAGVQGSPDKLQLSNLAAILAQSQSLDADRSGRLSQLTAAVKSNTFQFNPAQISSAIISEAAQPTGR